MTGLFSTMSSLDDHTHYCPSDSIFCNNKLLHVLQTSSFRPFADSKTLVDLPLRSAPHLVLDRLERLPNPLCELHYNDFLTSAFSDRPDCIHLYSQHTASQIVIPHTPSDYTPSIPSFLISPSPRLSFPPSLAAFAADLKHRWPALCRRHDPAVILDSTAAARTSLLPLPHPFFVPGGRFRECYYWDTLWIVKGLLASDMLTSAQDAVRNLVFLVQKYGFVPNGTRTYYLSRTQPPVLSEAVRLVYEELPQSQRLRWLCETIPALDAELRFFHTYRSISKVLPDCAHATCTLSVYAAQSTCPRPESFAEDIRTAAETYAQSHHTSVYRNIATAAESGWDFSSRWFSEQRSNHDGSVAGHPLAHMRICEIVPVCLNSILLRAERTVAGFHRILSHSHQSLPDEKQHCSNCCESGDASASLEGNAHAVRANELISIATNREKDMVQLFWDPARSFWFDFDTVSNEKTQAVSCAGFMPIWAECNSTKWTCEEARRFVRFVMHDSGLLGPGGLAATSRRTGQQWDFPNCWPPLMDFAVNALENLARHFPQCGAGDAAAEIARRFILSTYKGWRSHNVMHEKYDVTRQGMRGEGGEYEPQTGFGWTNGTVLWLIRHFFQKNEAFWSDLS